MLVNAQVVLVPLLALVFDRESVSRRFVVTVPIMVAGVVLAGGVLEERAVIPCRLSLDSPSRLVVPGR